MDAIIYFRKERGLARWNLSTVRQEDHLLVKIAVDVERKSWFGRKMPSEPQPPVEMPCGGWMKKRRMKRAAQREYQRKLQEYEAARDRLEEEIRTMAQEAQEILQRADIRGSISCVYEKELRFLTEDEAVPGAVWNLLWNYPVFTAYTDLRWMIPVLAAAAASGLLRRESSKEASRAGVTSFFLLGFSEEAFRLLEHCARGMKELCWYLQSEDLEQAEEIAEEFYNECGVAASLRILEGKHPFRRLGLTSGEPACVLDFTAEEKIFVGELAGGSIWIDFLSAEEKEERIRRQASGVRYFSLKKLWRLAKPKARSAPPQSAVSGNRPGYNPRLRLEQL